MAINKLKIKELSYKESQSLKGINKISKRCPVCKDRLFKKINGRSYCKMCEPQSTIKQTKLI